MDRRQCISLGDIDDKRERRGDEKIILYISNFNCNMATKSTKRQYNRVNKKPALKKKTLIGPYLHSHGYVENQSILDNFFEISTTDANVGKCLSCQKSFKSIRTSAGQHHVFHCKQNFANSCDVNEIIKDSRFPSTKKERQKLTDNWLIIFLVISIPNHLTWNLFF